MKNKIRLFWYKLDEGHGNFGDEINPYLVEKLTGETVEWAHPFNASRWISAKSVLRSILGNQTIVREITQTPAWNKLFNRPIIFAIGSVIRYADTNVKVWGSGIISKNEDLPNAKFLAVRGKHTQERLRQLGHNVPDVLGDPAILLPKVLPVVHNKKYKVGIIPHHFQFEFFREKFSNKDVPIIDLLQTVEDVVSAIASCEMTLCTSLHGIIVSHAYGIPSLWINPGTQVKQLSGDDIKFADYFSSVGINEYSALPLNIIDLDNFDHFCNSIFRSYSEDSLPSEDQLLKIRKELLTVAPFTVLKKYLS